MIFIGIKWVVPEQLDCPRLWGMLCSMLQVWCSTTLIKRIIGGLAYEGLHEHILNFVDVFSLFSFRGKTQKAIRLRLFSFSLSREAMRW